MKKALYPFLVLFVTLCVCASCGKDADENNNNPNSADTVSKTKTCYDGSGNVTVTGKDGFTGFTCNYACGSYSDASHLQAGSNITYLAFADKTATGMTLGFYFNGKEWPKSGTYSIGSLGLPTSTEAYVVFFGAYSKKTQGNTIQVTNDNGKITITSSKIEMFDIAGNLAFTISDLNVTKTNNKN